jgi:hypothetical protein
MEKQNSKQHVKRKVTHMFSKEAALGRGDQIDRIGRMPEPFSPIAYMQATGKASRAAASQMRRWIKWGWLEKLGVGQYKRTAIFGSELGRGHGGKGFQENNGKRQNLFAPQPEDNQEQQFTDNDPLPTVLPNGKLPDSAGEGKSTEWLKANFKRFHCKSRFYKAGWFAKNNYWKNHKKKKGSSHWEKYGKKSYYRLKKEKEAAAAASNGVHPEQQQSEVVPCKLAECPNCQTRFYMAKGPQ